MWPGTVWLLRHVAKCLTLKMARNTQYLTNSDLQKSTNKTSVLRYFSEIFGSNLIYNTHDTKFQLF